MSKGGSGLADNAAAMPELSDAVAAPDGICFACQVAVEKLSSQLDAIDRLDAKLRVRGEASDDRSGRSRAFIRVEWLRRHGRDHRVILSCRPHALDPNLLLKDLQRNVLPNFAQVAPTPEEKMEPSVIPRDPRCHDAEVAPRPGLARGTSQVKVTETTTGNPRLI